MTGFSKVLGKSSIGILLAGAAGAAITFGAMAAQADPNVAIQIGVISAGVFAGWFGSVLAGVVGAVAATIASGILLNPAAGLIIGAGLLGWTVGDKIGQATGTKSYKGIDKAQDETQARSNEWIKDKRSMIYPGFGIIGAVLAAAAGAVGADVFPFGDQIDKMTGSNLVSIGLDAAAGGAVAAGGAAVFMEGGLLAANKLTDVAQWWNRTQIRIATSAAFALPVALLSAAAMAAAIYVFHVPLMIAGGAFAVGAGVLVWRDIANERKQHANAAAPQAPAGKKAHAMVGGSFAPVGAA